jgi:capsular exopolysaccharide synthesis family protein
MLRADERTSGTREGLSLREIYLVLRRRKWYVVATALIAIGTTALVVSQETPIYQSTAQVLVANPRVSFAPSPTSPINLETERSIAGSAAVAKIAAEKLDGRISIPELLAGLNVGFEGESEILQIIYSDLNPGDSRIGTRALAEAYLEFRQRQFVNAMTATEESLQQQIESAEKELEEINSQLDAAPDDAERRRLEANAISLSAGLISLRQQVVQASENPYVGQLVGPPSPPRANDTTRQKLVFAGVFGLSLGVGIALLVEAMGDRLRGRQDLEQHAAAPVLAFIPRPNQWKNREGPRLTVTADPDSPMSEAYKTFRTAFLLASSRHRIKTVLITSPKQGEGKSTTVANLGAALANAGKKVVLVVGDLRKPRLHEFLLPDDTRSNRGLTNVLAGESALGEALVEVPGFSNLKVLLSGPLPGNSSEVLGSNAMGRVLVELKESADFVLVDGAPILTVSDSIALSRLTDGVLLVADATRTKRGEVDQARHQLQQVGARLLGFVLHNTDSRTFDVYGNGYSLRDQSARPTHQEQPPQTH